MKDREGQPSGQNPEWEVNKEQNIAIAKRVHKILEEGPSALSDFNNWLSWHRANSEEMQDTEGLEFMDKEGFRKDVIPDDIQDAIAIEELTEAHEIKYWHVENNRRNIMLGVAYSEKAMEGWSETGWDLEEVPLGFNLPVFVIKQSTSNIYDTNSEIYVSIIYGEVPNDIIGADGLPYRILNTYCFNTSGQGLKIERITQMGALEDSSLYSEKQRILAEQRLKKVDFVPWEEHSRVVPLTPDDYTKINNMLAQIDAGSYKFRA